jgi:hypothetical protein
MHYFRKLDKYLLILLFPALSWLFINNSINGHSHRLKSGYIIYHAHPYKKDNTGKSPFQSHNHSNRELFLLDLISNILFILAMPFFLSTVQKLSREIKIYYRHTSPCLDTYTSQNYRGPPSL